MGVGNLRIEARTGDGALPVSGDDVRIKDDNRQILSQLKTDENGNTEAIALSSLDKEQTLGPINVGSYYNSICDVEIVTKDLPQILFEVYKYLTAFHPHYLLICHLRQKHLSKAI